MGEAELEDLRHRIRHSAAHVMADVVKQLYPDVKLAIGPPTEDGFYYDFMTDTPFSEEDLDKISTITNHAKVIESPVAVLCNFNLMKDD